MNAKFCLAQNLGYNSITKSKKTRKYLTLAAKVKILHVGQRHQAAAVEREAVVALASKQRQRNTCVNIMILKSEVKTYIHPYWSK